MPLSFPEKSGMNIINIENLGPGQAIVNMRDLAVLDGAIYAGARLGPRNIVISIIFLPKPTIEATRHQSYRAFPIKSEVTLVIETDAGFRSIRGYVEANNPFIFSPEEYTQISVVCDDPYFYVSTDEEIHDYLMDSQNGDPIYDTSGSAIITSPYYENPDPLAKPFYLSSGLVSKDTIRNTGTSEIGIKVLITQWYPPYSRATVFKATGPNGDQNVQSIVLDLEKFYIDSGERRSGMITISTVPGNRYIIYEPFEEDLPTGEVVNLLPYATISGGWITLDVGPSKMWTDYTSNISYGVTARTLFSGV